MALKSQWGFRNGRLGMGLLFLGTAGLLLTTMPAFADAKPDVIKGGPFGKPNPGKPENGAVNKVKPEKVKDKNKPKVLDCDEPYEVDVTVVQEAGCGPEFDFSKIRQRAKEIADQEIAQVTCPADEKCFVPSTWYGYWSWGCKNEDQAEATVSEFKVCQEANTKVTNGVGDGSHLPQNKPQTLGGPPPKDPVGNGQTMTVTSSTSKGNGPVLDCGVSFLASYVYEISTEAAEPLEKQAKGDKKATEYSTIKDFSPFYDEAYAKAKAYHDQFSCKDPAKCGLTPFDVISGDLQANGGAKTVTITLYFMVACKGK